MVGAVWTPRYGGDDRGWIGCPLPLLLGDTVNTRTIAVIALVIAVIVLILLLM